jgi:predicted Zn-dependent protease
MNIRNFMICALVLTGVSCSKVPVTGRKQLNLLPESQVEAMSLTAYKEFLSTNPPAVNTPAAQMVKNVGARIASAVNLYLAQQQMSDRIKGYVWEFNLVENKEVNAWCMPGGKVVVYTGILPITQDEAGLAVVMGHEIAHAIARHGNERMSQGLAVQLGGVALDVALSQKPQETRALFGTAYGLGANLGVILPFSRTHETEADKMGLIFMAMAGFDPNNAVSFWQRMAAQGSGGPPEFLSTHPSDQTRIADLKAYMPEAMKYYKKP